MFILGLITFLGFIFIFLLINKKTNISNYLKRIPGVKNLIHLIDNFLDGLTLLKEIKHFWKIAILTIVMWFIYYLITWTVNLATGIGLNWIGVGIVLIFTSMAIAIPAAPSAIGTYHAAAIYVLTEIFLFNRLESQSFAVLLHFVGFIPLILLGAIFFIRSSVSIKDVAN